MDLSVIIVNYNVRQFLENALTSVRRAMEGVDAEIIVVDNASSDRSAEMVRSTFPEVVLIQNGENLGFARANNIALRRSRGRFILLLNPDAVLQEGTLRAMLDFFARHPEAGLAGCKVLNPDGSFQLPCRRNFPTPWVAFTKIFGLSTLFPRSRIFGKYNLTYLSPDETYRVDAVSGSFMMIRREVYEKVGGLDETFFMYGEDLDWCYRVKEAGYEVFYVHATQIVHFKGESTKRSNVDEIRLFYNAMEVFVEKHYRGSFVLRPALRIGIGIRAAMATLSRSGGTLLAAVTDFLAVDAALLLASWIYFADPLLFPHGANPLVWIVPAAIVVAAEFFAGVYTAFRHSVARAMMAVVTGFLVISALTFFAKEFAYSRAVVVVSGVLSMVFIPGWRLVAMRRARRHRRRGLFTDRAVVVGTGPAAQEVVRRLRRSPDGAYDVLGLIGRRSDMIGETAGGTEVIGSLDNIAKVIAERRVSDVIFSTEDITYTDILSVIARSNAPAVSFRLVPTSLEAIVGKARVDELDSLPLVDITYNIHNPANRIIKRLFDLLLSGVLLVVVYPVALLIRLVRGREATGPRTGLALLLPRVFAGHMSFVGLPVEEAPAGEDIRGIDLGPSGLTGLVQLNRREGLSQDEIDRHKLYYAKNQSLAMDLEILLKSLFPRRSR